MDASRLRSYTIVLQLDSSGHLDPGRSYVKRSCESTTVSVSLTSLSRNTRGRSEYFATSVRRSLLRSVLEDLCVCAEEERVTREKGTPTVATPPPSTCKPN